MPKLNPNSTVLVVGANGGIGNALIERLSQQDITQIIAISRTRYQVPSTATVPIRSYTLKDYDETSIQALAQTLKDAAVQLDWVLIATGLLHNQQHKPEKKLSQLKASALQALYQANAVVPLLWAQALLPLLPKRQIGLLAAISARVGSISDNRLGGWYSYRASKAGLNMLFKTLSIELQRSHANIIVSVLHPGTTATALSQPFQANVPAHKLFTPQQTAAYLLTVMEALQATDSGRFYDWDGELIEW